MNVHDMQARLAAMEEQNHKFQQLFKELTRTTSGQGPNSFASSSDGANSSPRAHVFFDSLESNSSPDSTSTTASRRLTTPNAVPRVKSSNGLAEKAFVRDFCLKAEAIAEQKGQEENFGSVFDFSSRL